MDNWIYEHSTDNKYRFSLGTKGERTLICFGVNPSTAEPIKLDPTLKSVERFALQNGYDSYLMLNLSPQRATNPKDMDKAPNIEMSRKNLEIINTYLSHDNCDIWAAWGTLIVMRPYLFSYLREIYSTTQDKNNKWYTIGKKSKDGHPHHPLYLKKVLPLEPFDINKYIQAFHPQKDNHPQNTPRSMQ